MQARRSAPRKLPFAASWKSLWQERCPKPGNSVRVCSSAAARTSLALGRRCPEFPQSLGKMSLRALYQLSPMRSAPASLGCTQSSDSWASEFVHKAAANTGEAGDPQRYYCGQRAGRLDHRDLRRRLDRRSLASVQPSAFSFRDTVTSLLPPHLDTQKQHCPTTADATCWFRLRPPAGGGAGLSPW